MKKLREGDLIGTFEGHEDGINCLAIAADESVLVSGSEDGTARIWDLEAVDEATKPLVPGVLLIPLQIATKLSMTKSESILEN